MRRGPQLCASHLLFRSLLGDSSLKEIAEAATADAERRAIHRILQATRGNKSEAARLLRTDYKTLHLKDEAVRH